MENHNVLISFILKLSIFFWMIPISNNLEMKTLAFGYGISADFSSTIIGVSLKVCYFECQSRSNCRALSYNRRVHVCLLYGDDTNNVRLIGSADTMVSQKRFWTKKSLSSSCNCGSSEVCRSDGLVFKCEIEECSMSHVSRLIFGNMKSVGSRAVCEYQCYNLSKDAASSTVLECRCTHDGRWAAFEVECFETYESFIVDLGCYTDDWDRVLNHEVTSLSFMTIEKCAVHCYRLNYVYFGLESSTLCYCGNSINDKGLSDGCTFPCHGDSSLTCGGIWAIQIYKYTHV